MAVASRAVTPHTHACATGAHAIAGNVNVEAFWCPDTGVDRRDSLATGVRNLAHLDAQALRWRSQGRQEAVLVLSGLPAHETRTPVLTVGPLTGILRQP